MVETVLFHNGSTYLPHKRTDDGRAIPDGSLADVHADLKRVVTNQIEQGIRAEELGYDRVFFTEHHFQPTGSEFSTNPMMSQTAVAARTEEIRIGQLANIVTWHDPVRFAEQAAILDIVSGGRAEIGVGRGYQPRECEVLGQYWGGTIQDQERNRRAFEESLEIIERCWTEDTVDYGGEYHQVPPSHTKWHHDLDKTYFDDEVTEQTTDEMMDWDEAGDFYSDLWSLAVSGGTTLERIAVFPQPEQQPHPQRWMPTTSYRSIRFAARRGINGGFLPAPTDTLADLTEVYYEAAAEAGWPDRRPEHDGEPFAYGWDETRGRGVVPFRYVWNTEVATEAETERWRRGQEHIWNFYRPLLPVAGAFGREDDEWIPADDIVDAPMVHAGTTDELRDEIATLAEDLDVEGLGFGAFIETPGVGFEAETRQTEAFARDVVPYLEEEFPGPRAGD